MVVKLVAAAAVTVVAFPSSGETLTAGCPHEIHFTLPGGHGS